MQRTAGKIAVLCSTEDKKELESRFNSIAGIKFFSAIKFNDDKSAVKRAVSIAREADYLIFASKHSVRLFVKEMLRLGLNPDVFNAKTKVFAAGKATKKELEENGIDVYYAPSSGGLSKIFYKLQFMDRGIVVEISGNSQNDRALDVPMGLMYVRIKTYSLVICLKNFDIKGYNAVVFPSSAEVDAFSESYKEAIEGFKGIKAVCIGKKAYEKTKAIFNKAELCAKNDIGYAIKQARDE